MLLKSGQRKARAYEIGQFNSGCCGCVALYYSLVDGREISKQLIFEMFCGMGDPTVFSFTRNSKGDMQDLHRFIAVSDSTAEFRFNSMEIMLLAKLDSISIAHKIPVYKEFKFNDLIGYRTKSAKEQFHEFGIDQKGKTRTGTKNKK